jgi:hypothetical protein
MHVQRYSDPLKSARLRQHLREGSEGWYMPLVGEAVLISSTSLYSLFLFFASLGNLLLNVSTTVGSSTVQVVPIGIGGLLCIFTIFAPIIYPQSRTKTHSLVFSGIRSKSCMDGDTRIEDSMED